jgi:predicted transposase YbfD/YdcC
MASYSGEKDDCEFPVAQQLLKESGAVLENATVTTDALHTQKTNFIIYELGGENLSAIKNNQKDYLKYAEQLLKDRPVDLTGELTCGHGRYEIRDITLAAVDTEVSPFPHISQIIKCTRIYLSTKEGGEPEMSVRLFGTSHEHGSKTDAQLDKLIRGHWTVKNLNHWKRDASYWREDRAPKQNPRGAKNLALLRNALLAVIPFEKFSSLNQAFDHYRDHRKESLKIIKTASPCQD